jgi:uncharacterized protein YqeY
MGLREQLNEKMKEAMKAREQRRLSTIRLMLAALKDRDIANRTEESREGVSDDEILSLLAKMIKQREESAETYDRGGRPELASAEREEIVIIREFMPKQLGEEEAKAAVRGVIAELVTHTSAHLPGGEVDKNSSAAERVFRVGRVVPTRHHSMRCAIPPTRNREGDFDLPSGEVGFVAHD